MMINSNHSFGPPFDGKHVVRIGEMQSDSVRGVCGEATRRFRGVLRGSDEVTVAWLSQGISPILGPQERIARLQLLLAYKVTRSQSHRVTASRWPYGGTPSS